jgi:hypothetical protein
MWIGRREFEELKRKVEASETLINDVSAEIFETVCTPIFVTDTKGEKHYNGDSFTIIPLVSKIRTQINLLLKELGYEYKPETETKGSAKLVKVGDNSNKAKK